MSKDKLTDAEVKNAAPREKAYKLADGGGMFLLVTPKGQKWWRLKYRFEGKEKLIALGVYPEVGLKQARKNCDKERVHLAAGSDPGAKRKATKAAGLERSANSFEIIAGVWLTHRAIKWDAGHTASVRRRLECDAFPWLGALPIADITPQVLLQALRRVEARGAKEQAHKLLQHCSGIFRFAVAAGHAERDPASDLRGALEPLNPTRHRAAITDPKRVGDLLRALDGYKGSFVVRCALQLAPMVFTRPRELRCAEWSEIDFDNALWSIPAEKMKMRTAHVVPLATQSLAILRDLHALTGRGRYVFPGGRSAHRPLSENAVLVALRALGFSKDEMTGHGFRAIARTLLDEVLHQRLDLVEHQLAHVVRDPLGRAYNRTTHLPERREMMQKWADYLDSLKAGGNVIPLHKRA